MYNILIIILSSVIFNNHSNLYPLFLIKGENWICHFNSKKREGEKSMGTHNLEVFCLMKSQPITDKNVTWSLFMSSQPSDLCLLHPPLHKELLHMPKIQETVEHLFPWVAFQFLTKSHSPNYTAPLPLPCPFLAHSFPTLLHKHLILFYSFQSFSVMICQNKK